MPANAHPIVSLGIAILMASVYSTAAHAEDEFKIERAKWNSDSSRLIVKIKGKKGRDVVVSNAYDGGQILGSKELDEDEWKLRVNSPTPVPCRVRAEQSNGQSAERNVKNAPDDCAPSSPGGGGGNPPLSGDFTVLAANDLGMHCADLDYQVFSILPPFNVVHAQVIKKGTANSMPSILTDDNVSVTYTATSSANDPALLNDPLGPLSLGGPSVNTSSQNLNGVFKSNFWEDSQIPLAPGVNPGNNQTIGGAAYDSLYPGVQVVGALGGPDLTGLCGDSVAPFDCPSALQLFEPLPADTGIPVPSPADLYPANPADPSLLITGQQHMPGSANVAQEFDRFDRDLPFFVNFDFGYRGEDLNWFAADGIPILPVDDVGRSNAYPLMKIAAHDKTSHQELSSLDIVLPVASEADCQNCHVQPVDCADPDLPAAVQTDQCIGAAVEQTDFNVITLDDNPPGETRLEQLLNTAKINILRLHDVKHGASYQAWDASKQLVAAACDASNATDPNCLINQTPVQCSQCHYSPALDLAQAGPVNEPEQGAQGRQQASHISMSRAMHGHHGSLPDFDAGNGAKPLFPAMPGPVGRNQQTAQNVLEQTCYQCHPGKRTECLRGAMYAGGAVCQDCHGDMQQVGNDFTLKVSASNPADYVLDGSLRVPWASEPGCQSCHTGDARNTNHPADAIVADDGIRLLQAYKTQNIAVPGETELVKVASLIQAPNSRFAENQAKNAKGDDVGVLYRLSKGHGGLMCEGCHNSTHAIWPIENPFANDNIAANQLQGHAGTIIECTTCHDADNFEEGGMLELSMNGPHGLHPVGRTHFADGGHEEPAEDNPNACRACHGNSGEGTVLSVMATTRTLDCDERGSVCGNGDTAIFQKGHQVTCHDCHENEL